MLFAFLDAYTSHLAKRVQRQVRHSLWFLLLPITRMLLALYLLNVFVLMTCAAFYAYLLKGCLAQYGNADSICESTDLEAAHVLLKVCYSSFCAAFLRCISAD